MLSRITPKSGPAASPELVRKLTHEAEALTGIHSSRLLGPGRPADVALVRQVLMFLLRECCGTTWEAIGEHFGGRDHGTAIHAHKKVATMLKVERESGPHAGRPTAELVRKLTAACGMPTPRDAAD